MREQDLWVSQLRKGLVEIAVLGMLASRSLYGQQLVDELAARPELAISAGTVYPLLSRLKKAGLVDSTWQESPVGPPRKYYRLTDEGVAELEAMRSAWLRVSTAVTTILNGESV